MAPLVLGIVLGDLLEKRFRRGLVLSDGSLVPFFTRPICIALWVTIVLVIAFKIPGVAERVGRLLPRRAQRSCHRSQHDASRSADPGRPDGGLRPLQRGAAAPRDFAAQCEFAAKLGYDGLEVAPFTLGDDPLALGVARRAEVRRTANATGVAITGLHWLLVKPDGLSVTSPDAQVRARTIAAMQALVELCVDLGGRYLVHGSPAQRRTPEGADRATARAWIARSARGRRAASRSRPACCT